MDAPADPPTTGDQHARVIARASSSRRLMIALLLAIGVPYLDAWSDR